MGKPSKPRKGQVADKKYNPNMEVQFVEFDSNEEADTTTRKPLFSIDGVTYEIDTAIAPNLAIKYLNNIRTEGAEYATAVAMTDVLGEEAMEALANYDKGDRKKNAERYKQIMAIVENLMLGAVEEMQGNS